MYLYKSTCKIVKIVRAILLSQDFQSKISTINERYSNSTVFSLKVYLMKKGSTLYDFFLQSVNKMIFILDRTSRLFKKRSISVCTLSRMLLQGGNLNCAYFRWLQLHARLQYTTTHI